MLPSDGLDAGRTMRARKIVSGGAAALVVGLAVTLAAQTPAKQDFDAEYRAAVQGAKNAAGFDFLGTLVRTCLLPQSGGENASDAVPNFVADPSKAPKRDTWYADPA